VQASSPPITDRLRPFDPLTEEDLGPSPDWSGCFQNPGSLHGRVVFRSLPEPPETIVDTKHSPMFVSLVENDLYQEIRDEVRARCPKAHVKINWHVAECQWCGARSVRPGLVVRVRRREEGLVVEREYSLEGVS